MPMPDIIAQTHCISQSFTKCLGKFPIISTTKLVQVPVFSYWWPLGSPVWRRVLWSSSNFEWRSPIELPADHDADENANSSHPIQFSLDAFKLWKSQERVTFPSFSKNKSGHVALLPSRKPVFLEESRQWGRTRKWWYFPTFTTRKSKKRHPVK